MQTSTIALIVDDNGIRHAINAALSEAGYAVLELDARTLDVPAAINGIDAVCLGTNEAATLDKIAQFRAADSELPIIVVTGQERIAELAVQKGAYDCAVKPVQPFGIQYAVARAVERRRLASELTRLRSQLAHYEGAGVVPLRDLERQAIERALRATNGSVTKAAKILGIGRATLYRRLSSPEMADLRAIRGAETGSSMMRQATMARESE